MLYRNFSTQEELDAQYNLRVAVPDFPRYAELYEQESRKAREEELERRLDVPFGPTLAESLDVFPAARERAPVLIYFHGGYWHSLSKEMFSFVARGPVSAGVAMVVDYTLCPKVAVAEIVRQARAAVAWTYRNADGFRGDPERLFVAGHSAGGHLAAMAALTDWEGDYGLPPDTVKGGFPIPASSTCAPSRTPTCSRSCNSPGARS